MPSKNTEQRNMDILARRYLCLVCDKACRDKYTLTQHVKKHIPKPPKPVIIHKCVKCPYSSKYKQNWKRHTLICGLYKPK